MQETRDMSSNLESGRSPGEASSNPLQYSCLENHFGKGGRRPGRRFVRGAPSCRGTAWDQPGASTAVSIKCGSGRPRHWWSDPSWSLTSAFLALCFRVTSGSPCVLFLSFRSVTCKSASANLLMPDLPVRGLYSNFCLENGSYKTPGYHQKERGGWPSLSAEPQHLLVWKVSPALAWTI